MKIYFLRLLALGVAVLATKAIFAANPSALRLVDRVSAAPDMAAVLALLPQNLGRDDLAELPPAPSERNSPTFAAWREQRDIVVWEAMRTALRRFPEDPQTWEIASRLVNWRLMPRDAGMPGEFQAAIDAVNPPAQRAAYHLEMDQLVNAAIANPALSAELRSTMERSYTGSPFARAQMALFHASRNKRLPASLADYRELLASLAEKYPEDSQWASALAVMAIHLRNGGASNERILAEIEPLVNHPVARFRQTATNIAVNARLIGTSPAIRFIAFDGREVDLASYRGKVVLLDFWATWCGACRAEMPNINRVYAAYRDVGFEVIGITAEKINFSPQDTPEQREKKITAARAVLAAAITKENLPYPQYFNPEGIRSPLLRQFGVTALPLHVLIDRNGMVVSTNEVGDKLEPAVRRALGL